MSTTLPQMEGASATVAMLLQKDHRPQTFMSGSRRSGTDDYLYMRMASARCEPVHGHGDSRASLASRPQVGRANLVLNYRGHLRNIHVAYGTSPTMIQGHDYRSSGPARLHSISLLRRPVPGTPPVGGPLPRPMDKGSNFWGKTGSRRIRHHKVHGTKRYDPSTMFAGDPVLRLLQDKRVAYEEFAEGTTYHIDVS